MVHELPTFRVITGPEQRLTQNRPAPERGGNRRQVRSEPQGKVPFELIGGAWHEAPPELENAEDVFIDTKSAGEQDRGERVEVQLELRHDAEIAAAPAQRPVKLGILVWAGAD